MTAPEGAQLSQVLSEARTGGSFPAGCVTSFAMLDGRVTSIDGVVPGGDDEAWQLRLDRGSQVPAGEQPVRFGETISLRLGVFPSSGAALATREGPIGPAGATGPRGKPGAKRGPSRKAQGSLQGSPASLGQAPRALRNPAPAPPPQPLEYAAGTNESVMED